MLYRVLFIYFFVDRFLFDNPPSLFVDDLLFLSNLLFLCMNKVFFLTNHILWLL